MTKILLVWELGGGLGHLERLRPIARRLSARGHYVVAAVRNYELGSRLLASSTARVLPAPPLLAPDTGFTPPVSYAHILHNIGFGSLSGLTDGVTAWAKILHDENPDVVVFDHSPTALLACRLHNAQRVLLGDGFCCPPTGEPMPVIRPNHHFTAATLLRDERTVLRTANIVLTERGLPPLGCLSDLYADVNTTFLTTLPELHHFGLNDSSNYVGLCAESIGESPRWPKGSGPRVFAYLKPIDNLPFLLQLLLDERLPTIVFAPEVVESVKQRFQSPTLRFADQPVDFGRLAGNCEFAIGHATHGTTAAMLLAGIPILMLPIHVEQWLMARRVITLGAGVAAFYAKRNQVTSALRALLTQPCYDESAKQFALKHGESATDDNIDRIVGVIESIGQSGRCHDV